MTTQAPATTLKSATHEISSRVRFLRRNSLQVGIISVLLVMWKERDSGLALAGVGSAVGPKSGLAARDREVRPGDRPLVSPRATANPFPTGRQPERPVEEEGQAADSTFSGEDGADKPRPAGTRRQVQRRQRRM